MRSAGDFTGGMFVLPSNTPLRPGNGRYLVTGTSGGHTRGSGDRARPDLQMCVTKRGTLVVRRGDEDDRSAPAAKPDTAHESAAIATTNCSALCFLCIPLESTSRALIRSISGSGSGEPSSDFGKLEVPDDDPRDVYPRRNSARHRLDV
jgi:hypothetical protein